MPASITKILKRHQRPSYGVPLQGRILKIPLIYVTETVERYNYLHTARSDRSNGSSIATSMHPPDPRMQNLPQTPITEPSVRFQVASCGHIFPHRRSRDDSCLVKNPACTAAKLPTNESNKEPRPRAACTEELSWNMFPQDSNRPRRKKISLESLHMQVSISKVVDKLPALDLCPIDYPPCPLFHKYRPPPPLPLLFFPSSDHETS